ncbi:MAG: helix-turn-helix transcriptional regulator [Eubacterium sp.]|nr:helix-turn-helix transcriptional regulator [Eubacterium sp.]
MRLSEKIMDLRKKSGWSQEELADRLGISRQSVSKWETGESVPDIDKIIRMSELWNVSTDYLLKEEEVLEEVVAPEAEEKRNGDTYREFSGDFGRNDQDAQNTSERRRQVSHEEVTDFLTLSREAAPRIATGVLLCILSPVCLLLMSVLSEKSAVFGNVALIPENAAGAIGLVVLLVLVAIAVAVFITTGMRLSKYEYMEKEWLEIPEDVIRMVADEKENFAVTFRYSITIGVVLCIVGVIPLVALSIFTQEDLFLVIGVCVLLVFVAVGVFLIIHAGMIHASYDKLLQTGDYTPGKKKAEKLSGAYWSIVVAIYLGYSFLTGNWGISWIIFPVAGVLFGAISAVLGAIFR